MMPGSSAENLPMNLLDMIAGLILAGGMAVGLVRGFGKTAFDAIALYAALWASSALAPVIVSHFHHSAGVGGVASADEGWVLGLLFCLLGGLMLGVSWYTEGMTLWNAGIFDKLLGLCAGFGIGAILAHTLITCVVLGRVGSDPDQEASTSLGSVSSEFYNFTTYHAVLDTITGAKTYRNEFPDADRNIR